MDPTKTRIWHTQELGLAARSGSAARPVNTPRPPVNTTQPPLVNTAQSFGGTQPFGNTTQPLAGNTLQPQRFSLPPLPPDAHTLNARRSSVPPPPPGADTLQTRRSSVPPPPPPPPRTRPGAPRAPLAATRIMPIEALFPRAHAGRKSQLQRTAAPRSRMLKRVGMHVLLGTLTLLAVAAWKLPRAPARARLMPLQQASLVEERSSAQPPAAPQAAAQPAVAAPARPAEKFKTQQERRAIELVIAGDDIGAAQAYRALASEQPDNAAFREAARILAARQSSLRHGK